jgi:hypothetical protein
MSENVDKLRLADRTEAILRSDRLALRRVCPKRRDPAVLLTLVPDVGAVIDLMDAYLPDVAEAAGLQYVRMVGAETHELPEPLLTRTFLVLADVTGRDETVVNLVYQALGQGRRILLSAQDAADLPSDLGGMPQVIYGLGPGEFDALLRAVRHGAFSTMEDEAILA